MLWGIITIEIGGPRDTRSFWKAWTAEGNRDIQGVAQRKRKLPGPWSNVCSEGGEKCSCASSEKYFLSEFSNSDFLPILGRKRWRGEEILLEVASVLGKARNIKAWGGKGSFSHFFSLLQIFKISYFFIKKILLSKLQLSLQPPKYYLL